MQKKRINAKKRKKCKKKAENARSISKLMQKRVEIQKKGRKYIFNFEIHTKKNQKWKKKKADLFGFFWLLYPLCIFLHFKPKNSYKKRQKCKKKTIKIFSNCKNKHAKKSMK